LDQNTNTNIPRVSTIHSLALGGIRKNPQAFGLADKVTPLDDWDQSQLMRKVIERYDAKRGGQERERGFVYSVLEKIGFHRARGVGFRDEYTHAVHEKAMEEHAGYHALSAEMLDLWERFEDEKRKNSVVDFDDMLCFFNRRARSDEAWRNKVQSQFSHVLVDEAQDISAVQWELIEHLLGPDNRNLYVVGDMNQCQPPNTQIKVFSKNRHHASRVWDVRSFSSLSDGELVASLKIKHKSLTPRPMRVAKQHYEGPMLTVRTKSGHSTKVTPNHDLLVQFAKGAAAHLVYLMYREGFGYRIGTSKLQRAGRRFGLVTRMNQEQAEKGWVLKVCESVSEALLWEEIYSFKYGIPECRFVSSARGKTPEGIKTVFSFSDKSSGTRLLADLGLLEGLPLVSSERGSVRRYDQGWRGYFRTAACNVLAGIMEVPLDRGELTGPNECSSLVSEITVNQYCGDVYSMEVEENHNYVADGIVVGNSIYGFNGAVPKLLKDYSVAWRGVTPRMYKIQRNHRSVPEIVNLANAICGKMTETIPLKMQSWRGINGEAGLVKLVKGCLAQDIAAAIASEIQKDGQRKRDPLLYKDNAILVRSAAQIRDVEGELVRRRVPYIVRGGRGLLQTEEVRDILAYLRLASNYKDFMAFTRCCAVPRCGVGDASLAKLRIEANQSHGGDLIAAAKAYERLHNLIGIVEQVTAFKDAPITALEKVLALFDYRKYVREKYKRDVDKVKAKLENIDRFVMMVVALTEETGMTLDDLIFQLTLDRPKGDGTEKQLYDRQLASGELTQAQYDQKMTELRNGSVTISTIHSAKGLEWTRVYVTNIVEGSLPHRYSSGNDAEIEEERRLIYVACTRARDTLVLCVHEREQRGPNTARVSPSRFLIEIGVVKNPDFLPPS
jgi:DNA helicase-2/ATP-dependent DNA helicase PcrA